MSDKISRRSLLKFCAALGVSSAIGWTVGPLVNADTETDDIEDAPNEAGNTFTAELECICGYFISPHCAVHSCAIHGVEARERLASREQEESDSFDRAMEWYERLMKDLSENGDLNG